ncbi:hypothetical protein NU09_2060 [Flavobacterium beibuense]|uniref:YhhN-like protein n=1 Tax=Flavobacterium beibuense TaxID=657326 RepID=A0A444WAW1_9FLAO|nr:hypothetical protein NU09_2060 [Flavobacterium beibuense]
MLLTEILKPTQFFVAITFFMAWFFLKPDKTENKVVLSILTLSFFTEIITLFLLSTGNEFRALYTIAAFLHHSLWIYILCKNFIAKKAIFLILMAFFVISLLNFLFYEGPVKFNHYTFITGGFIYILIFICISFIELKKDNLSFFSSNNYLLLFSPIIFIFGLSFIFGFKSKVISNTIIINHISLYDFIGYFVNFIYYTLINVYIYKENKLKNGQ